MDLYVVEDVLKVFVSGLLVLKLSEFHHANLLEHDNVGCDEVVHLHEGIHDTRTHVDRRITVKYCGEHRFALFCEDSRHVAPPRDLFFQFRI